MKNFSEQSDPATNDLIRIISERSQPFVFWTGAGVSAPIMPTWDGLLKKLNEAAKGKMASMSKDSKKLPNLINAAKNKKEDLWALFEQFAGEDGVGPETFRQTIKQAIKPSESADIPEIHKLLWQLRPKGIVTLNLDLFTHRAAAEISKLVGVPINIFPNTFRDGLRIFKESRPFIAYPHGHFDHQAEWTLTVSALNQRLSNEEYINWTNHLFTAYTVIFIGITADDIAINSLLEKIVRRSKVVSESNFWITSRNDEDTDSWAENNGIRVIRYDPIDESHSGLKKFIKTIIDYQTNENPNLEIPIPYINRNHQQPTVLPPPDEIDIKNKQELRKILNLYAHNISKNYQVPERDIKFRHFLEDYSEPIHNAYYVSTIPGKNKFFDYTLEQESNGGAFGKVYKATDQNGEHVAIKILHAEKLSDIDFYRNFRRGVNSLRILSESAVSGIVGFKNAVEIPPTLVMEWIEGATLADAVKQKRLSILEKIEVLFHLADILCKSHALPERVLHRDLRPANIMLKNYYGSDDEIDVIVLDFDLSWHKGAEDHSIMYSPALGYLAPEQRRRVPKATTKTTLVDSYGFGMVMFYVITGKDPIPDAHLVNTWDSDLEKIRKISFKSWQSATYRIARIIKNLVKEEQNSRLEMPKVREDLAALFGYINNPERLSSISVLTEELVARIPCMNAYTWDDLNSCAVIRNTEERTVSIKANLPYPEIILEIDWRNSGKQDWSLIEKSMSKKIDASVTDLQKDGWEVNPNKTRRSYSISAKINIEAVISDLNQKANVMNKVIEYTLSM